MSLHTLPHKLNSLGKTEFIALMAMLAATVAFSIDAMLPALPQIGAELSPGSLNNAQMIITSFVLGMGVGTFFAGPLADRFGRRQIIFAGAGLYIAGALLAYFSTSLEAMLAARVLQGLGAAGPRIGAMAMIRDLYAGRNMARILSFVLMVFALIPAFAPTMGAGIIYLWGWRAVFLSFIAFSVATMAWLFLRQPETLSPDRRRPLSMKALMNATIEVFSHPTVRLTIFVQTLSFAMLFIVLSSTQQVFDITYGRGATFHYWFGGIAAVSATAGLVNARYVVRVGMRAIIKITFTVQIVLSALMVIVVLLPLPQWIEFAIYVIWNASLFFQAGLTIGNLSALGLEPMGHMAGMASSIMAGISTIGSALIAAPIGLMFDGTPVPMAIGVLICAILALWLTIHIRRDSDPE